MMSHIMLDLETLGTRPGSVILSIGAVAFDHRTGLGAEFHVKINQRSSERAGLTVDKGTLGWWMRQSPEARALLDETRNGGEPLDSALDQFAAFVRQFKDVRIWGCGSSFDGVLLSAAYATIGRTQPWRYVNDRCYRTLKALVPSIAMERDGVHHSALDDAKSQAVHAMKILSAIAGLAA